ncbi:glycosyltransferase [bacterium]|nr:glycosyltransferase [bacterium]
MKVSLWIQLIALGCYALTLFYFIRLLIWRWMSDKQVWRKKLPLDRDTVKYLLAHQCEPFPFISLLIPAKNESVVIQATLSNLAKLDYPVDRFEILVITDEREENSNARKMQSTWESLQKYDRQKAYRIPVELRKTWFSYRFRTEPHGPFFSYLHERLRREFSIEYSSETYTAKLPLVIQKIAQQLSLDKKQMKRTLMIVIRQVLPDCPCKIQQWLYRNFLQWIEGFISPDQLFLADSIDPESWKALFPTTLTVATQTAEPLIQQGFRIKILTVPEWYDGVFIQSLGKTSTDSTKGRALNWALQNLDERCTVVGFYDAESQPAKEVLLHVAFRYAREKEKMPILQGPLFQVRNFYLLGILSRLGGLYKALSHDWYLPVIFKSIPFAGGTNLFIRKSILTEINGFNPLSLTEDLELGVRAFQQTDTRVEFLPVISTEQTPPQWHQFFVQRLRWASGHLEVMNSLSPKTRLFWQLFIQGPLEWLTYQFIGLVVLVMNLWFLGVKLHFFPTIQTSVSPYLSYALALLNIPYILFSFYCLHRYAFTFDSNLRSDSLFGRMDWLKLIVSALFVFLLPLPYTYAIWLRIIGKAPTRWVKTVRTAE